MTCSAVAAKEFSTLSDNGEVMRQNTTDRITHYLQLLAQPVCDDCIARELQLRQRQQANIVCLGAGAADISCMKLLVSMGAKVENIFMLDRKGVIHADRDDLNQYKAVFAHSTEKRSLADALDGADVFVGLSGANLLSQEDAYDLTEGWLWALDSLKSYLETGKRIGFDAWKAGRSGR